MLLLFSNELLFLEPLEFTGLYPSFAFHITLYHIELIFQSIYMYILVHTTHLYVCMLYIYIYIYIYIIYTYTYIHIHLYVYINVYVHAIKIIAIGTVKQKN